jgi:phage-related protein
MTGSPCQGLAPGFRKSGFGTLLGYRVIYVAKFADVVYVLHRFKKKTQKTSKTGVDLAEKRYRDLTKELGQ